MAALFMMRAASLTMRAATDECRHASAHALLPLREDKQLFERKFARLHHFLHLSTASTIGDRRARRGNSLFVSERRRNWSHEVRIPCELQVLEKSR